MTRRLGYLTILAALPIGLVACGGGKQATADSAPSRRDSAASASTASPPRTTPATTHDSVGRKDSIIGRDSVIQPRMGLDKKGRKVPIDTLRSIKPM
jgi:hypothetical protein